MDIQALTTLARALVEAPSPTGMEGPALLIAERALGDIGLEVDRQEVGAPDRFNVLARSGRPRAVLCTHLDTVPGALPVRIEDGVLHGRGACDAKGIAAAMIAAAGILVDRGLSDFGVLLVVGEETTSDGAIAANEYLRTEWCCNDVLLGEPTSLDWIRSHPGVVTASLACTGLAAHSSDPSGGHSAIHALLDLITRLRSEEWPNTECGPATLNIGRIAGGTASNVVAGEARADIMLRSGGDSRALTRRLTTLAGDDASLRISCASSPVTFSFPEDEPSRAAAFATDAPFLDKLGSPWLLGPGDIRHAHSADERVSIADLGTARDRYVNWTEARLKRGTR